MKAWHLAAWSLACASSLAQVAVPDSMEAVESERTRLQRESTQAEALCYERFAVNACLSGVLAQRRAYTAALKKRELALRDAQRAERTHEQLLRLEEKQADSQERSLGPVNQPLAVPKAPPLPVKREATPEAEAGPSITPAQAAANRAAFEAKQEEAARYQAEVERRVTDKKDRAAPLPVKP